MGYGKGFRTVWVDFSITTEAGKQYKLSRILLKKIEQRSVSGFLKQAYYPTTRIFLWIEDIETGKVISGYKPKKLSGFKRRYDADLGKGFGGRR